MLRKLIKVLRGDERGITGLETAIILIAFVVVASVFAYTVLSAGIFSSQKGQEAVHAGLAEARATMVPKGSMYAYSGNVSGNETVAKLSITLGNSLRGQAIDLTPPYILDEVTGALEPNDLQHVTVITYVDKAQYIADVPWTVEFIGKSSGDFLLEDDEKAVVTVWLVNFDGTDYLVAAGFIESAEDLLGIYDSFSLEIKPVVGASLIMERTLPGRLDPAMDLN